MEKFYEIWIETEGKKYKSKKQYESISEALCNIDFISQKVQNISPGKQVIKINRYEEREDDYLTLTHEEVIKTGKE